jgi:hypothetical protein
MGFFQSSFRARAPVAMRAPVFAVGRRMYVACPEEHPARVALTDDAGANALTSLADGTEVEILAWRPRGFAGTRYRVRSTRNGREGWLAAGSLRNARSAIPSPPGGPTPATTSSGALTRRSRRRPT